MQRGLRTCVAKSSGETSSHHLTAGFHILLVIEPPWDDEDEGEILLTEAKQGRIFTVSGTDGAHPHSPLKGFGSVG